MKINLIIFLLLLLSFSCNTQSEKNNIKKTISSSNYKKYYDSKKEAKKLADSALTYGDTNSYNLAFKQYGLLNCYDDFLYYTIKMSQKHDFNQAYFDTYYLLTLREKDSLNNLANYYLFKAFEKGNIHAKYEVNEMYPNLKHVPKSSYYIIKINNEQIR